VQARRSWNRPASVRRRVSCTASGRSKRRSTAGTPPTSSAEFLRRSGRANPRNGKRNSLRWVANSARSIGRWQH